MEDLMRQAEMGISSACSLELANLDASDVVSSKVLCPSWCCQRSWSVADD